MSSEYLATCLWSTLQLKRNAFCAAASCCTTRKRIIHIFFLFYLFLVEVILQMSAIEEITGVCRYVASGPLVRSSYRAGEFFIQAMIEEDKRKQHAV